MRPKILCCIYKTISHIYRSKHGQRFMVNSLLNCRCSWLYRWLYNSTTTLTVTATRALPAVASLASMLRNTQDKTDLASGQRVSLLSLPQVEVVNETDQVTCHSPTHTQPGPGTGMGTGTGRDRNVVEEVLVFGWLIPRVPRPPPGATPNVMSGHRRVLHGGFCCFVFFVVETIQHSYCICVL